ncbi:hypothetical protein GGR21_004260 [Dysgonomonas hofstadii]|uniref:Uncharacterized protein n=1 Tax=Dysgonomonas hofstadii TaxID=637886 RepID=A0A840CSC8_9BACT|nr:hypothetical protein [Dysgonomonas hofstadii]MBB4038326.1 hypothetical protein [Dysgonomonas hofstadii]
MLYKEIILPERLSLYDSNLLKMKIYTADTYGINIEAVIKLGYPSGVYLKLIFKQISEFLFFWSEEYDFYVIESYKLLRSDNGIYCSFDPADRDISASENDGAVIKCSEIEGYSSSCIEFSNPRKINFNI